MKICWFREKIGKKLTLVLQRLGPFRRQRELVDVVLQEGGPVLQLVHDVPGVGHAHRQHHGRVGEVGLLEGELQQVLVVGVPVQRPNAQTGVL